MISEEKRAYNRAYYEKNRERVKEQARRWYRENRERSNANSKKWYHENREYARAKNKEWYERNRERVLERERAKNKERRFTQHGLTEADYRLLAEKQGNVCAICRRECDVIDSLSIDHCHETGRVRGLLCKRCNSGLGFFREEPALLRSAIEYLEAA